MTKRWWERGPRGARAIRTWIASPEGKSTPLLQVILADIESLELLLIEVAQQSPNELREKLRILEHRTKRFEKKLGPPDPLTGEAPAAIVPLHLVVGQAISNAVRLCDGDVEMAAAGLEIGQATIYRKMKKYGMDIRAIRRAAERREADSASPHVQGRQDAEAGTVVPVLGIREEPVLDRVQPSVDEGDVARPEGAGQHG